MHLGSVRVELSVQLVSVRVEVNVRVGVCSW